MQEDIKELVFELLELGKSPEEIQIIIKHSFSTYISIEDILELQKVM